MKRRGFTLIELLAVIVILAIIALIATPIVMNVIENSRKGAAERSAENYLRTVETAIATERLDNKILTGKYIVQSDGNLCPREGECTENTKVMVEVSGNKPNYGSEIIIENGLVTNNSIIRIGEYNVSYNETKESYVANKLICTLTSDSEGFGTEIGSKYTCDVGSGELKTFYVLEDGDTTTIEQSSTGTGEVSLIMDSNLDGATKWCTSGSSNSCDADGAKSYLATNTSNWTVDTSLPTYAQLAALPGVNIYESGQVNKFPSWILYNLDNDSSTEMAYGYWTSTVANGTTDGSWIIAASSNMAHEHVGRNGDIGVRPVITISKNQI